MTKSLRTKIVASVLCVVIASLFIPSMAANPGSEDDPLVSMSYINDVLMPQVKSYVDTKATETSGNAYEVVNLKKGQKVIGGQSTEFILRMGSANIVATEKGGLADVTDGVDLKNGTPMPANHLLIVPFDDWRGITMQTDGIVMIKGKYSITN